MGFFRCKNCDRVLPLSSQSTVRVDLCCECYNKLEDLYSRLRIHDYIRDHGLQKDFDPEEVAREIGINPRNIKLLHKFGFFDRDIQTYNSSYSHERQELAEKFKRATEVLVQKKEKTVKRDSRFNGYKNNYRR